MALGGACGVAALLAVAGALILLPSTANRVAMALLTVAGTAPVLLAGLTVNRTLGALLAAALSAVMLAVVTGRAADPGCGRAGGTDLVGAVRGIGADRRDGGIRRLRRGAGAARAVTRDRHRRPL